MSEDGSHEEDHGHEHHGHHDPKMHSMDLLDAINTRRSIRKFSEVPVEWDQVLTILDAGRMAPSSGNVQNWRFVLFTDPEKRLKIAEACFQQYWIAQAPLILVVVGDTKKAERFYGQRGATLYTIQNCAAATQNILLTVHSLGLGSSWVGAFDEGMMNRLTGAPEGCTTQAVLPIGYPEEKGEVTPRFDLAVVTRFESFDGRFQDMVEVTKEYSIYVQRAIQKSKTWWKKIKDKIQDSGKPSGGHGDHH